MRFIYTKTFAIFAGCIVVVSLLAIMQLKGWLDPVTEIFLQSPRPVAYLTSAVAKPVKYFFSTIYDLRRIDQENTQLKRQVVDLQQQLVDFDQERRENEALRKEMGFASTAQFGLVSCTVLAENPFGATDAAVLNCGTSQGISVGQAVISQGYLVGKIVYAGKSSSTALLAASSKFSADVELSSTGSDAVINGSFGSGLVLDHLSQNADIQKGWLVVTAGINQQIPKGILVGQIGDIISSPNDLFKRATVVSPIDFNSLDFVFVAKP